MKRIIATLAAVTLSTPTLAQRPAIMNHEVERIDKMDMQGVGVGTALLKITNSNDYDVLVTIQCSFVDRDLRPLASGSNAIPNLPMYAREFVTVRAEMPSAVLERLSKVQCSVNGTRF